MHTHAPSPILGPCICRLWINGVPKVTTNYNAIHTQIVILLPHTPPFCHSLTPQQHNCCSHTELHLFTVTPSHAFFPLLWEVYIFFYYYLLMAVAWWASKAKFLLLLWSITIMPCNVHCFWQYASWYTVSRSVWFHFFIWHSLKIVISNCNPCGIAILKNCNTYQFHSPSITIESNWKSVYRPSPTMSRMFT